MSVSRSLTPLAFALLAALSLSAADDEAGSLQLADSANLIRAIRRVSGLVRNPTLGAMAPEIVRSLPTAQFFGRSRPHATTLFLWFRGKDDDFRSAVLYPTADPPEALLKRHRDAKLLKDGVVSVPCDDTCEICAATAWPCVVFSKDRRWAGAGDSEADARRALKEAARAERPMSNDLIRVTGNAGLLSSLLDDAVKSQIGSLDKELSSSGLGLTMLRDFSAAVRVGERGLDLEYRQRLKKESGIAEWGKTVLPGDALKPAETNAVAAYAVVCKMPSDNLNVGSMMTLLGSMSGQELHYRWRETGRDFTAFRMSEKFPKNMAWMKPTNAVYGASFAFDGRALPNTDLAERFDRILPECRHRPLQAKFIGLLHLVAHSSDDRRNEGLAYAAWCEGECLHSLLRLTPAEMKLMSSGLFFDGGDSVR